MHLLDTNTLIYYFKGIGRVAERLLATPPTEVAVSTITLYELEVGLEKRRASRSRRNLLAEFERVVHVLPFGRREAQEAARIRAALEKRGMPIGPLDNLIAGVALAAGATLVTHNQEEFARIPRLNIVDWV
jgi:tRNA(fMet)-specific endonuclease VapC